MDNKSTSTQLQMSDIQPLVVDVKTSEKNSQDILFTPLPEAPILASIPENETGSIEQEKMLAEMQNKLFLEWTKSLPKGLRTLIILNLKQDQLEEILHSSNERLVDESIDDYHQRLTLRKWITKYRWQLANYSTPTADTIKVN